MNKTVQETPFSEKTVKFRPYIPVNSRLGRLKGPKYIQGVREISAIIVTDDYVKRNQKVLKTFFSYFNIQLLPVFKFKTSDEWRH